MERTFSSAYDPRSIMDYCWVFGNLKSPNPLEATLSDGDVQGIQKLAEAAALVDAPQEIGTDAKPAQPAEAQPASEATTHKPEKEFEDDSQEDSGTSTFDQQTRDSPTGF